VVNAYEKHKYTAEEVPLRKTVLNRVHHDLGAKTAPFAGWEMPIRYPSGILAEHRAVRTAAALFDVSHMTALEVHGQHATLFLETVLTSRVSRLQPGQAHYSCMLYPDGTAVDDLFAYRLETDRFMLVVNAANAERVKAWIDAVNSRRVVIDEETPAREIEGPVEVRDLRSAGDDSRVGLAFQGPASSRVLRTLCDSDSDRDMLERLAPNSIAGAKLAGLPTLVARTGYTGERFGYEIFVHPETAEELWGAILQAGKEFGVSPAGLGARDSTRIEAGLPLFGHELEGELGISITEAGYGFAVRRRGSFFVGQKPYLVRTGRSRRYILRLQGQGRKTLRPGHVILDASGKAVGQVASFAYVHADMTFIVLACVGHDFRPEPGQVVRGARIPTAKFTGSAEERSIVDLAALTRFPNDAERDGWPDRYA